MILNGNGPNVRNIAIIPARGGSKRIKNKNLQLINGKEIIRYTIDICKKSELFEQIVVSSDDPKILSISKEVNVDSIIREPDLCDDLIPLSSVMKNAVENFPGYDNCCLILATAVMLNPQRLIEAAKLLQEDEKLEFVIGIQKFESKVDRKLEMRSNNLINIVEPSYINKRSQDLKDYYYDSGAFSFGRTKHWLEEKQSFKANTKGIILSRLEVIDIDIIDDLELVRQIMR